MSDSAIQPTIPTSTTTVPNFGGQIATPMKTEAADPALVKEMESFLASRAVDPETKAGRPVSSDLPPATSVVDVPSSPRPNWASPATTAPADDKPKTAPAAGPEPAAPDASAAAPAAPTDGGPKPSQRGAGPEVPLAAGVDQLTPTPPITASAAVTDGDPKADRAAASAGQPAQMTGSERLAQEALEAKPATPAAANPKPDQGPMGSEPPPHPGPDGAKAAGPERVAVKAPASASPARQPRKAKADPVPEPDRATATTEAPTSAQASAMPRETKLDVPSSLAGREKAHAVPSPGSGMPEPAVSGVAVDAKTQGPAPAAASNVRAAEVVSPEPAIAQQATVATRASSALGSIMSSRRQPSLNTAPWKVPVPAIGARIAHHEQRVADGKTARLVTQAEKSGIAMEASLDRFMSGPARGVMNSLKTAAANDPGGMPAVIAGMKPGGAYAAERVAFDTAIRNPAVGADYTAMADSAQRHTKDRYTVENNIHQRGLDPAVLGDRFTRKDAELGEKAASIPGREAGKSALEEMAQKLAELLSKAMEKVGKAFGRTASADVQATARPSPSPGMSP